VHKVDKAKNSNDIFGPSILAIEVEKITRGEKYVCPDCNENVFHKGGTKNKPCFSHFKAEDNDSCSSRVKQYNTFKKNKNRTQEVFKWYQQVTDVNLQYNPCLPEAIFDEIKVWHAIADFLIEEIISGIFVDKLEFISQIEINKNISSAYITKYLNELQFTKENILNFFWEIFLRFRWFYNCYEQSQIEANVERKLVQLFHYIEKKISKADKVKSPLKFWFDESENKIICKQIAENEVKSNVDLENFPKLENIQNVSNEIKKIFIQKFIIAIENEFGDGGFISTNRQIEVGTHILIIGELSILELMKVQINPFLEADVFIFKNIVGLSPNCGVIDIVLGLPNNAHEISNYPNWLARPADFELVGGLKLKQRGKANTYMSICPPLIVLTRNINSELLEIKDSLGNSVDWQRIGNKIKFNNLPNGEITIHINGTPYMRKINIEAIYNLNKNLNINSPVMGWHLNGRWPSISKIENNENLFIAGPYIFGGIKKILNKIQKESEWFQMHSGLISMPKNKINKLLSI